MEALLAKVLDDPTLRDVAPGVARHELALLVAQAQRPSGATQLQLSLRDGSVIELQVLPQWTVAQLKRLVERTIARRVEAATGKARSISWKKHWTRWAIELDGSVLDDGRRSLESFGVKSSSGVLHFVPRRPAPRATTKTPAQPRRRDKTR